MVFPAARTVEDSAVVDGSDALLAEVVRALISEVEVADVEVAELV